MEYRNPLPQERVQVENLWAYCFEPKGHPFFEWYFKHCYEPENILVGVQDGQVVSDIHLRQYTLNVRGKALPTTYIVGVATHPAARRGGIGGELLRASLAELKRRGQGISILMPSKAAFYQQYGWELYAHQWVTTMPLEELRPLTERSLHFGLLNDVSQWTWLAPVYEAYTKSLSGYAMRGEKEWTRLLESLFNEGAQVAVVRTEEGRIEGYLVYTLGAPEIMVSEFVYTTRRAQKALLNYLYNHRSQGETVRWNEGGHDEGYAFWPNGKSGHSTMPFMMSRVVDVPTAVEAVPFVADKGESLAWTLAITDPLVPWNEGVYRITKAAGEVKWHVTKEKESVGVADVTMTVGALGLLLMGRFTATELAFEAKLDADEVYLRYLDNWYPKMKTYINEWW